MERYGLGRGDVSRYTVFPNSFACEHCEENHHRAQEATLRRGTIIWVGEFLILPRQSIDGIKCFAQAKQKRKRSFFDD